ncbi:hypothetical protein ACS0TY_013667 [Phlomoides rotata]
MPSNYFLRLHHAIRQVLPGRSRLIHSLPSSTLNDLNATAQANSHLHNRKKNLSVFGAFSHVISIPSVLGPSFQVCRHHIDCLLSEPSQLLGINSEKEFVAVYGSNSDCVEFVTSNMTSRPAHPSVAACHSFSSYSRISFGNWSEGSTRLRDREQPHNFLLHRRFLYSVARRKVNAYTFLGLGPLGFKGLHSSSTACSSPSSARDLSFSNTMREEWHSSSADSTGLCRNIPIDRSLKLNSGSCYLPHPDKEETGGEDAHFICTGEKAIGVADGVGGWADHGVDAGKYARELMSNSVNAVQEEPKGSINPARVLEKAYNITKSKGSSTACIIALTDEGLHAINLGDSGFMVVRDGCTVFRSPVQQHAFNYTFQLESGSAGNLPSSGQVFTVAVAPGDVIIAGTDGLFDNLYNNDIVAIVVHAVRAGLGPQVTAKKIAALARQRALDKNRQTPFSTAAQEAGFRYYGGKLDDITIVVSYITSDHNRSPSAKNSN